MKTFMHYLILITLTVIIQGCVPEKTTPLENTSIYLENGHYVYRVIIDEHDYLLISSTYGGFTHSGNCRKCQKERNKIINKILNK